MSLLHIEWMKLKRSKIWLPILILPFFSIAYGSINYSANREILQSQWISLWTQVYLFYGSFFYPCLIALICAFIWHSEHKQGGVKLLLTSGTPLYKILFAKMLVASLVAFLAQAYFMLGFFIAGQFFHFSMPFPKVFIPWLLAITLFSSLYVAVQSYLSLKLKSFAIPVAMGLGLGFICFLAVAQGVAPETHYMFAAARLSLLMNNSFESLSLTSFEWIKMIGYTLLGIGLFTGLQYKALKGQTQ